MTYLDSLMTEVFPHYSLSFSISVIFGGVRAQKPPKKGRGMQNFENFLT